MTNQGKRDVIFWIMLFIFAIAIVVFLFGWTAATAVEMMP